MTDTASLVPADLNAPACVGKAAADVAPMLDAAVQQFAQLQHKIGYLNAADRALVEQAYHLADRSHLGQKRKNGDPYITHPIAVATQVAEWKIDAAAVMAALLHDTIEDCGVTREQLQTQFGATVADLVDGLTKLEQMPLSSREENQAQSFRKLLLVMARDVRVILIKLADRLHNMRTMGDMPRSKWSRISTETMDLYVPLAHRLGLHQTYRELQDLAFKYLKPWRYEVLHKAVLRARQKRRTPIHKMHQNVQSALAKAGIHARLIGREKTLYSIYRKMCDEHLTFARVNDLYGARVVVDEPLTCYTVTGLLHKLYHPVPGKFMDYIAIPKINGYQSLHTTVTDKTGLNIEFQIRTEQMDSVAELGILTHWLHPSGRQFNVRWLESMLDIQKETPDAGEFWENIKGSLASESVYILTPQGDVYSFPPGATPIDFAYALHSELGDRAVGAKVDGAQVPLRTPLKSGNTVEIITDEKARPNPSWLGFVRTGRARSKIRHALKNMTDHEAAALGEQLLHQSLRAEGLTQIPEKNAHLRSAWLELLRRTDCNTREEMLREIGLGRRVATLVARQLAELLGAQRVKPDALSVTREYYTGLDNVAQGAVILDGAHDAAIHFARCCYPIPGDRVVGYLDGRGLTVHTENCVNAQRLNKTDAERRVTVDWAETPVRLFQVAVTVLLSNGVGVLARLTAAFARAQADIVHIAMPDEEAQATTELRFIISVRHVQHLENVLRTVRHTAGVVQATRCTSPMP